jgi:hypothetical protein
MKVLRYSDYIISVDMAQDFLDSIGKDLLTESNKQSYKSIIKKTVEDLKLNASLVLTFGTGLSVMIPLVSKLVENMKLKIDLNPETVVLMTITAVTIAYIEENKQMHEKKKMEMEKDAKSMLEESKLRGVGNNIIKKLVKCIKSIGNLFKILFKNSRHVVNGFFDMFGYSSLVVPVINAILYMIGKYDLNLETLPANFLSLGVGVTTIAAKHGLNYLIDLIKDKLKLNKADILKGINDIDDPILKKYPHPEYIDTEYDEEGEEELIKEQ